MNKEEQELYDKLTKKFPDDAISSDTSRGFELTSLKAQYIVERLNEVFGLSGWSLDGSFEKHDKGILFIGYLKIKSLDHKVQAVGFSVNKKNLGDSYKSSRTDALSKAASWLGVGNEIFKGHGNLDSGPEVYDERNIDHKKALVSVLKSNGIDVIQEAKTYSKAAYSAKIPINLLEPFVQNMREKLIKEG